MLRCIVCCNVLLTTYGDINHLWDSYSEVTPCFSFDDPTLAILALALSASYKFSSSVKYTASYSLVEIELMILCLVPIVSWLITGPLKSVVVSY